MTYLKSIAARDSSKLKSETPPNLEAARRLDHIVATAENIEDGHWLRLAPLYEPFAPVLMKGVRDLNVDIVSGVLPALTFPEYVTRLVERVSEPVSA